MGPAEIEFLTVLGYFFLLHERPERAVVVFEALAALAPDQPLVRESLAFARLKLGRYEDVLSGVDALLARDPTPQRQAIALFARARALHELGRGAEAGDAAARFIEARRAAAEPGA